MKIQILQENLLKSLNTAGRSISSKAQLPVLANILLATENNRLKISATNLELSVSIWAGAKIEEEGSTTLPAKIFQEYVSSLPAEKVDLAEKNNIVNLSSGSFNASFNGLAASEFPVLPRPEKKILSFPSKTLSEVISRVAFAAADDEGRPILTGVCVAKNENDLVFAATDGYRLSVKRIKAENLFAKDLKEKDFKNMVIPSKTLLEAARIMADQSKQESASVELSLTKDANQAIFSFPEVELSTKLLEGDFPDYEKIIPGQATTTVKLDKESLVRAVKTASIFARDSSNIVKFKFAGDKTFVSANSPQVGENSTQVEAKIEGEPTEIAFNFRFLLDFLSSLQAGEVILEMTGSLNPGVFKVKEDPDFLHIIMPVRLQS